MLNSVQVRLLSSDDLPLVLRLLNTSEYIYQRFTLEELPMLLAIRCVVFCFRKQ